MNEKKAKFKKLLISEKKEKNYESSATEKERMNKKKISWWTQWLLVLIQNKINEHLAWYWF